MKKLLEAVCKLLGMRRKAEQHTGSAPKRSRIAFSVTPGEHFFPEILLKRLRSGKYTRWAEHLDWQTLQTLLWACGELGVRAGPSLYRMEGEDLVYSPPLLRLDPFANARLCEGLKLIHAITQGQRITLDEARREIGTAVREAEKRRFGDPRLTSLLRGRSITGTRHEESGSFKFFFSDHTCLEIPCAKEPVPERVHGTIEEVLIESNGIRLNFTDDSMTMINSDGSWISLHINRSSQSERLKSELGPLSFSAPPVAEPKKNKS